MRIKIFLLYVLSFLCSIGPVSVFFLINWDRYVQTLPEKVKLSCGIVFLLVIVLLKVMGKLRLPSRAALFGIIFVMCYLLEAIIDDLLILSFLALVGELLDAICQLFLRRMKKKKDMEEVSETIANAINGLV